MKRLFVLACTDQSTSGYIQSTMAARHASDRFVSCPADMKSGELVYSDQYAEELLRRIDIAISDHTPDFVCIVAFSTRELSKLSRLSRHYLHCHRLRPDKLPRDPEPRAKRLLEQLTPVPNAWNQVLERIKQDVLHTPGERKAECTPLLLPNDKFASQLLPRVVRSAQGTDVLPLAADIERTVAEHRHYNAASRSHHWTDGDQTQFTPDSCSTKPIDPHKGFRFGFRFTPGFCYAISKANGSPMNSPSGLVPRIWALPCGTLV